MLDECNPEAVAHTHRPGAKAPASRARAVEENARNSALLRLGKLDDALKGARALAERPDVQQDPWIHAQALYSLARLEDTKGQAPAARLHAREAARSPTSPGWIRCGWTHC